jgi:serine/threonine protein kinase
MHGMENCNEDIPDAERDIQEAESSEMRPALEPGRTIGRWRVSCFIGRGGMAEVYEVVDMDLEARYALKLFTYSHGDVETARKRFFAEGRLLAQLDHPRLVRVYDLGEDSETGRPYFIMDLVLDPDGQPHTLADADVAGVDEEQVAVWYEDLRDGLSYIHAKGILHRDLKLQNIMIGPDGHAVLSDFGVAKIFSPDLREKVGLTPEQTLIAVKGGQKTVMGSVGYMAPEVELGVAASKESDWYALGVIVFRLLTGVWCDARTDVMGDLETYSPVWRDIIPKLLHANPSGRECPSWHDLERTRREEEAMKSERVLDVLRAKRHAAVRGRRNAWLAAIVAAVAASVLACFVQRVAAPPSVALPPDFDSIVKIPPNAPEEETDGNAMPTRDDFAMARIDAWVLTHDLFADLKAGKVTREKVVGDLRRLLKLADEDELALFDSKMVGVLSYTQIGETEPLVYLLRTAVSNLTTGVEGEKKK